MSDLEKIKKGTHWIFGPKPDDTTELQNKIWQVIARIETCVVCRRVYPVLPESYTVDCEAIVDVEGRKVQFVPMSKLRELTCRN